MPACMRDSLCVSGTPGRESLRPFTAGSCPARARPRWTIGDDALYLFDKLGLPRTGDKVVLFAQIPLDRRAILLPCRPGGHRLFLRAGHQPSLHLSFCPPTSEAKGVVMRYVTMSGQANDARTQPGKARAARRSANERRRASRDLLSRASSPPLPLKDSN